MNPRPSFQFYPRDWRNDLDLQGCSLPAQALLINFICVVHDSDKYGVLCISGAKSDPFADQDFAKKCAKIFRITPKKFQKLLRELLDSGVLKQDENGAVYCNRMLRDQRLTEARRAAGKRGGNPNLLNQKDNQNPTPSSSTTSSFSTSLKNTTTTPTNSSLSPGAVVGSCCQISSDEEDCIRLLTKYAATKNPSAFERVLREKARQGDLDISRLSELREMEAKEIKQIKANEMAMRRAKMIEELNAKEEKEHLQKTMKYVEMKRRKGEEGPVTSLSSGDDACLVPPAASGEL
ncbi:MAG: hypothetical protein V3573_13145 [Desulfovibrionaceae bacterium]